MKFEPAITPYLRPAAGVGAMMREVIFALVPAAAAYVWFFGIGVIFNLVICVGTCVACEAWVLKLRQRPVAETLSDYSAVVTGILLAFALPPLTPWWISFTAAVFAIGAAKHLYGGLGFNAFNPAMAGYVVVLISFPLQLSAWLPPSMGDIDYQPLSVGASIWYVVSGNLPLEMTLDAITRATPLDIVRSAVNDARTMAEVTTSPMFGDFGGRGWEWISNFVALGGLWLLYRRIIRWHIPLGVLAGLLVPAILASVLVPDIYPGPGFHLFSGATMLAAFFIATDPVSAATSRRGRLAYGFGIGILIWVIRTYGGYPDAVAFAVLLMNLAAPAIDRFSRPRILGHD